MLPGGATDMAGARKLLRPVSQELTKFHPDFADIFAYDSEVDALPRGGDSEESGYLSSPSLDSGDKPRPEEGGVSSLTDVTPTKFQHGLIKSGGLSNGSPGFASGASTTAATDSSANHLSDRNSTFPSDNTQQSKSPGVSLRRTQSMEARPRLQAGKNHQGKFHRRQLSVTPVIPEDPREHLYNITRNEPFSNAQPAGASLPLASSFGLDYSFNVTYAQLADFRRKQREDEMGGKMDELSAEIKASSTVPKSPFDRTNIGEKSATRSVSTGSSETGVSKSKKKKAPAPPPPANVPPLTRKASRDQSPSKLSVTTEPPADYDMGTDASPAHSPPSSARALQRSLSSAGEYGGSFSSTAGRLRDRNSGHESNPQPQSSAQPPAPPPPPAPPLPGAPGALKFPTPRPTEPGPPTPAVKNKTEQTFGYNRSEIQKSVAEAKAQIEELKRLQAILLNGDSPKPNGTAEKTVLLSDKGTELNQQTEPVESPKLAATDDGENKSDTTSTVSTPRMSSLLQHDIVLAAQARGAKVVRARPPPALERPKDMAEIFREELAKAAQAREERRSREVASESFDNNNNKKSKEDNSETSGDPSFIFQSSFLKVSKKPPQTMAKPDLKALSNTAQSKEDKSDEQIKPDAKETESGDVTKQSIWIPEIEDREERDSSIVSKRSSIQSEDMSIGSSNASQRVFLPTWTPEHDLDSDDDIMNESSPPFTHVFGETRNDPGAGFKSSVLPTKIDSLKQDKGKKKTAKKAKELVSSPRQQVPETLEKQQNLRSEGSQNSSDKEEKKLGNLRKFHKGVKQAFGSISKASGKLLKRRKSQEILDIPADLPGAAGVSTDPNWTFGDSGSNAGSLRRVASEGHMPVQAIYQNGFTNGFKSEDDTASSSSESDGSEGDVGDIDFAEGLNDIPTSKKKKSKKTKPDEAQPMTRAGVAYVSPEGQIFVVPESSPDSASGKNTPMNSSEQNLKKVHGRLVPAHGLLEKAGRKFPFGSKEKSVDSAGQRRQEVDLKRLRELEAQERLHRLETAKMQEQITRLQRQQLERSHANLYSNSAEHLESPNATGNGMGSRAVLFDKTSHHSGNGSLLGQAPPTNSGPGFGVGPAFHRYSTPSFPSHAAPILEPRLATTTDPANYTAHTAPLVGGDSGLGSAPGSYTLPNFTVQELAYLSEYMRAMGVAPPSSHQQWTMLLNSFTTNNTATAPAINGTYNYNNHLVPNGTTTGFHQNLLHKSSSVPNQIHPFVGGSTLLGAGPNMSQVRESSSYGSENPVFGLLSASPTAVPSTPHPASQLTLSGDVRNSGQVNPFPSPTATETTIVPSAPTNQDRPVEGAATQLGTVHMNGNISSSNVNTHTTVPASAVGLVQDDGHLVSKQTPVPANSGRDGVRPVSMSSGVYGPMGFRQVST